MNTPPSSMTMVDLSGDPNIFPNTGIALATRVLADPVNWSAVVDQLLPRIAPSVILLMLVMNVLTQHHPLYHVELWAESLPLPILWGDSITAISSMMMPSVACWRTWRIMGARY